MEEAGKKQSTTHASELDEICCVWHVLELPLAVLVVAVVIAPLQWIFVLFASDS